MNLPDRRVFLKSLLAAAASASPAYGLRSREGALPPSGAEDTNTFIALESGDQQLRISSSKAPLTLQNFLRVSDGWKAASLPSPLVAGASLELAPTDIHREGAKISLKGTGGAEGTDGKPICYNWTAEISAQSARGGDAWFHFRTVLALPAPIKLQIGVNIEPQLITWLSSTSALMEGRSGCT